MQNFEKIASRSSSLRTSPVTSPRVSKAFFKSRATNSKDNSCLSESAAVSKESAVRFKILAVDSVQDGSGHLAAGAIVNADN